MSDWEVFAVKYADRNKRIRMHSFILDDDHHAPHPMDYFVWVIRRGDRMILVDSGYDEAEAAVRGRPILRGPREALKPLGIDPETVTDLVVTHLHYDHAGGLHLFPNAVLHMQETEMVYATGPCMCHNELKAPFSGAHICEAVQRLYAGKLVFYNGDAELADGITLHRIGGHSRGLQAVRVRTSAGWLVLASDASHFYENYLLKKPFPIVLDLQDMLNGFETLRRLASSPELIVPGHDPLVMQVFDRGPATHIARLDPGPIRSVDL